MPVVHVVTFTFATDDFDAVAAALGAALDDFAPHTKAIRYHHGADIGIREGNAHYAVTAIFEDQHAFQDYIAHPEHQRIIREKITPHVQSRSAVQFHVAHDRLNTSPDATGFGSTS